MAPGAVEVVAGIYLAALGGEAGEFDIAGMIEDPEWRERVAEAFSPSARIRFVTPPTGSLRIMEQDEFEGLEGLAEGWRIWMQPWEEFRIEPEDFVDAGEGRVLLPARATARMRDSKTEIRQETSALHWVENGQIVAISFYLDQDQARRDAGLD
jgi:hypothetical protein